MARSLQSGAERLCSDEEELLNLEVAAPCQSSRRPKGPGLPLHAAAAAVVALLGTVGLASWLVFARATQPRPLTVRSLLEGPELADVATDNLLSFGGEALSPFGRDAVREQVARRFRNISEAVHRRSPEAYEQLDLLELSEEQKRSVLRVLRRYSDPRAMSLATEITAAVRETVQARGDGAALKRRLTEKLLPKLALMQELAEDMYPGSRGNFTFDVEQLPAVHAFAAWHPQIEVDIGSQAGGQAKSAGRRATEVEVDEGVSAQAETFFQSLEHILGPKMPPAPARMLAGFFDDFGASPAGMQKAGLRPAQAPASFQPSRSMLATTPTGSGANGHESFMSCVMAAVPNPMAVISCIASNLKDVMSMVMNLVKGNKGAISA